MNNENSHLLAQSKVDAALSFQTSQRKSREDLSRANGDGIPTQQLNNASQVSPGVAPRSDQHDQRRHSSCPKLGANGLGKER